MSAPDTNVERQAKRHKSPLLGIAVAVIFAFIIAVFIVGAVLDEEESSAAAPNVNPMAESAVEQPAAVDD